MTADELCAWLETSRQPQRERLQVLAEHYVDTIRGLFDDDHARVVRQVKKRLNSPKLAEAVAAIVARLNERPANPRPAPPAPPAPFAAAEPPMPAPAALADDRGDELERAIAAEPTAREGYLVYGDWLEGRGDPRGPLVTMGAELAKNPGHKAMRAAFDAHLQEHTAAILGPLAACDDIVTGVEWFMGFIAKARASYSRERLHGKRPRVDLEDVLGWLLDEPGPGRFLQELTLGIVRHDDQDYARCWPVLARRPRPSLRVLHVGDFYSHECELNWSSIGDLSSLWPMVPNLRELTLRSGSMTLGPIDLPRLERLTTITGGLDQASLAAVCEARWPALQMLSLQVGRRGEGAAHDARAFAPLLAGEGVPRLSHLGIVNCELADEVVARLVDSPLLPRLRVLDLSMGTLSAAGAAFLERHAARFAHLHLDVDDNYLPAETCRALQRSLPDVFIGRQRDDRGSASNRYASAYE